MKILKYLWTNRPISTLIILCFLSYFTFPAIASDRFVDNGNGTVTDTQSGLMWISKDNGTPISWHDAQKYCEDLQVGGYNDWRMPTLAELASLYDPSEEGQGGYHTIKFVTITSQSCWASETRGDEAGRFNFTHGKEYWYRQQYKGATRVIAVRDNQ